MEINLSDKLTWLMPWVCIIGLDAYLLYVQYRYPKFDSAALLATEYMYVI